MKIKIPTLHYEHGYSDPELLFLNFMYNMIREHGKDTIFYMHAKDFRTLTGYEKRNRVEKVIPKFTKFYDIGIANQFTLAIKLKKLPGLTQPGTNAWDLTTHTLTDEETIRKLYFLIGYQANNEIVSERAEGFLYTERASYGDVSKRLGSAYSAIYHQYFQ